MNAFLENLHMHQDKVTLTSSSSIEVKRVLVFPKTISYGACIFNIVNRFQIKRRKQAWRYMSAANPSIWEAAGRGELHIQVWSTWLSSKLAGLQKTLSQKHTHTQNVKYQNYRFNEQDQILLNKLQVIAHILFISNIRLKQLDCLKHIIICNAV